jgi:hypothetical protein
MTVLVSILHGCLLGNGSARIENSTFSPSAIAQTTFCTHLPQTVSVHSHSHAAFHQAHTTITTSKICQHNRDKTDLQFDATMSGTRGQHSE